METQQSNNRPNRGQRETLRLGTRGSLLARMQSQAVADQLLQLHSGLKIELVILKTTGDKITDKPLHDVGGKGLFTKELEIALLNGEIDFAVHSYKDVPVTMPLVDVSDLVIAAVPKREDPRDVMVAGPNVRSIGELPHGAKVGTGSLRRQIQMSHHRPDLNMVSIRGNIDTRLKKQRDGEVDAVILAAAGLIRSKLWDEKSMTMLSADWMVPSACQGALALQCRAGDEFTRTILAAMDDPATRICTDLERQLILMLNADCHSPIGVHANLISHDQVSISVAIGDPVSRSTRFENATTSLGQATVILAQMLK